MLLSVRRLIMVVQRRLCNWGSRDEEKTTKNQEINDNWIDYHPRRRK